MLLKSVYSLPPDALAALTVASISIPQSISFATSLAHSSPIEGLVRPLTLSRRKKT